MMLATVVDPLAPALAFLAAAVAMGLMLGRIIRGTLLASLAGSILAMGAFVLLRFHLSFDFWAYAQDLIYEPLVRDPFQKPSETAASALFHLGVPYGMLLLLRRTIRHRPKEKGLAS